MAFGDNNRYFCSSVSNKATKYSQERDGCHYLSILGITVAQGSCGVRVWKISNKFSIFRTTHFAGYCSEDAKPQPPREQGMEDGQDKRGKRSEVGQPPQITAAGGERISNNSACRKHFQKQSARWMSLLSWTFWWTCTLWIITLPVLPPVERNANQRRTRKAVGRRACCSQGAS